ncbi:universal stress protein [Francisella orientalis]|uniref:Universal stress protein n=1 Tax=Francisella orientalis TaxID=299583 RepID=A0AAP6X583_9GAMM|nr:universal stress protein [Francisella orientalis]AFJ42623.1 universal stress protein [Francisella orientalis str. Toba 04]AHB97782.1 universal stress protein [Francisella orientalis LADL 07-285A]AKN84875.1 Universal stress protein [Francisella orientalis FNO12]AKN86413.1 Universal stress protein [Francisella orientalis FNO24]AKN87951.1 Universal stress protein [Francisella orientalis]
MAYKKILLAVNVYENADIVINSAVDFAKKNNTEVLKVVTVIDCVAPFAPSIVDFQHSIEQEAKEALDKLVAKISGIKVEHEVLVGNPAVEIVDYAEESSCDVIALGSHATHGINLLLGSVANAVLHKAKCDVLTVRVGENEKEVSKAHNYQRLLVPTDLENDSCIVVEKAKDIAKLYGSKIDTAFVIPNDSISLMTCETEKVEQTIEKFAEKNGITGEKSVMIGGIANSLLEKAAENKNDLIVVGSHRRSAIGRFFLGSTANSILHEANVDVLVVRLK